VDLASGTDRVHAVAQRIEAEIYVNIQGDEPMLRPEHIDGLLAPFAREHVEVSTLKVRCAPENIHNPNAVKVVSAMDGRALYFSRATIPFDRDGLGEAVYWKHLGLYAYRKKALERFAALSASGLERVEKLEQLRFLENGFSLYVEETQFDTVGVDTEEDLRRVEDILLGRV
jgi:3-deoxy-manno-octulosonate cytidylyltransferase (CMP-KDO synthetase)